jgi:hypothetical protein
MCRSPSRRSLRERTGRKSSCPRARSLRPPGLGVDAPVKVKLFDDGLYAAAELVTQGCKVDLLALLGVRAYLHAVVCENAAHHHPG